MADMDSLHPPTVCLSDAVIKEFKRILAESEITKCVSCFFQLRLAGMAFLCFLLCVANRPPPACVFVTRPNRQDDDKWPKKNVVGKQELEVKLAPYHISFQVRSLSLSLSVCSADLPTHSLTLTISQHPIRTDWTLAAQTAKIGSMVDVNNSDDPEGLQTFYYLVQDLKVRRHTLVVLDDEGRRRRSGEPSLTSACLPFLFSDLCLLAHLAPFQNQAGTVLFSLQRRLSLSLSLVSPLF